MPDGAAPEGGDASSPPGDHGWGAHLDRLLRAAEHEATEIREVAERRAAVLLTEAHAEIARHEQDRRRAWQEREVALLAAEQRSADELTAARDQAAQLVTAADQEAQGILGRARRRAEEISVAAAKTIDRGRRDAAQELGRLRGDAHAPPRRVAFLSLSRCQPSNGAAPPGMGVVSNSLRPAPMPTTPMTGAERP